MVQDFKEKRKKIFNVIVVATNFNSIDFRDNYFIEWHTEFHLFYGAPPVLAQDAL